MTIMVFSCEENELMSLQADGAVNFVNKSNMFSFIECTEDTYLYEADITIMGNVADFDRSVKVEAVLDSITSATPDQYEVQGGLIKANENTGKISVLLKNDPILENETVSLKVKIVDSDDILAGNVEAIEHTISWNDQIEMPSSWWYFTYFYSKKHSPACLKVIYQVTGIKDLSNYSKVREIGMTKVQALAVKFGDYVKQYNLDHPDEPLRHSGNYEGLYGKEAGLYEGDLIEPVLYTKSKYD